MKSITIHGLDNKLDSLIRKRSKRDGKSLNKTIKGILEESLGMKKNSDSDNANEFMDLFGVWSADDKKEFDRDVADFDKIDKEDWK